MHLQLRSKRAELSSVRPQTYRFLPRLEPLEDRVVPATFIVGNLLDSGGGSLRDAITQANTNAGPDRIVFGDNTFGVSGSIQLSSALPAITDIVDIDGTTSFGFTTAPTVEIDYNGSAGLTFDAGSSGSALRSLGHVNASTAGVTLDADSILLVGNYIGLRLGGNTAAGNNGGLLIHSSFNTIGIVGQPRNVISGNFGNGVTIDGGAGTGGAANKLVDNFIGTDATGLENRGNSNFGVYLTNGALFNNIGGTASKAKDSTVLTPGNLISANGSDGVRIDGDTPIDTRANNNFLGSNFIGTDITGIAALPNNGNGVSVIGADFNNIAGTEFGIDPLQLPFRFKNVISGNTGHGLLIRDAVGTNIFANFLGLGADNDTGVGNQLNGILIDGSSRDTVFGGVIPLGNVTANNGQHGLEIAGQATGTLVFNCFCGTAAFNDGAIVGNTLDGIHITSTGGNNTLRTNVISANGDDGIEISGNATGVLVDKAIIGLNTDGMTPQPNGGNGIEIGGNANNNVIGGFDPSVIPQTIVSANGGYGIAFLDTANNNVVSNSFIGTDVFGTTAFGNDLGGVFLDTNTFNNTIGGADPTDRNVISGNFGPGVVLGGTTGNSVTGNLIGTQVDGSSPLGNTGDGVLVTGNATNNLIGDDNTNAGNTIAFNTANGVNVVSGSGNAIRKNSIHNNDALGIDLSPGANNNQAAPILTSAVSISSGVHVKGSLTSTPNTTFTIEVFANLAADPSGSGEGRFFLGSVQVTTKSDGVGIFTFTSPPPPGGATFFSATATDPNGNTSEFSSTISLSSFANPAYAVGAGAGGGPEVKVFGQNGSQIAAFFAFSPTFTGGVQVATGDVNNDGVSDVIVGAGPGGGPHVIVVDGTRLNDVQANGQIAGSALLASFFAYDVGFSGGVFVAAGDVNNDGFDDIITGPGASGGPHVRVFSGDDGSVLRDFFAYDPTFTGGVRVAAGDINGNDVDDIITAAGPTGGPHVKVFDGDNGAVLRSFFAFDASFTGGIFVAAGDVDNDGFDDIIVGAGAGVPQVRVFDGGNNSVLHDFNAFDPSFTGGVRVASADVNGDGFDDIITGAGPGGGPNVRIFDGLSSDQIDNFFAFDPAFTGGIFVG